MRSGAFLHFLFRHYKVQPENESLFVQAFRLFRVRVLFWLMLGSVGLPVTI